MKITFLLSLLSLCATSLHAQSAEEALKAQLIKDWQRSKAYTQEYLDAMPADRYGYRPNDSVRTFAAQMLHLAQGNASLVANGTGTTSPFAGRSLERAAGASSRDSVVHYVNQSYDFVLSSLQAMPAATLGEKLKRGNLEESRLAYILKAYEHQGHHRGQTTIYLRMAGIRPPAEKLF